MIVRQSDQGSDAWLRERVGHVTASRFYDVISVSKRDGKPFKAREDYLMNLVCERLTGEPTQQAKSVATAWGTDAEPYARTEYEMLTGNFVKEVGFIKHPTIEWVGASSDGLVGSNGGIEIKCPYNSNIHLQTIEKGIPLEHLPQIYGQMWVLDLEWVDFISYDPRFPKDLCLYHQRIIRRDGLFICGEVIEEIENMKLGILKFLKEVEQKVEYFLEIDK